MSAVTLPVLERPAPSEHRTTLVHSLRAEWCKLWSLRSTSFTLLAFVALALGLAVPMSYGAADEYRQGSAVDQAAFAPTDATLLSFRVAWLAIMVLGVLAFTGEHATGMIRSSLVAMPRRARLLAAKTAVLTVVVLPVATVAGFATMLVSQAILASQQVPYATLGDPSVLRICFGTGLFTAGLGLLSLAFGTLLRATAGGISTMVAGVLILPNLAELLPEWWADLVQRYYPTIAGSQLLMADPEPGTLGPWTGLAVLCGAIAVLWAVALVRFQRRDA